jgi:predicted ATP-grasp superfamily ATP-dependent carboligase
VIYLKELNKYKDFLEKTKESLAIVLGRYILLDIGVIRSLNKKNIPSFILNPIVKPGCSYSKYYKGTICPNPKDNEKEYIDFLIGFGENLNKKAVLFPLGDIETSVILKNRSKLEKYYLFISSEFKIVEKFLDKAKFYETIKKHGISCPITYPINSIGDAKIVSEKIIYPCILKPVHSDYFRSEFKTKLFYVKSKNELIKKYKTTIERNHKVIVQEIIPGDISDYYGCDVFYDKNSNPNGVFMYRRIRDWPQRFGNGCLIESVYEPELEEITTRLIKKIGYHGIVDVEFKKDARDDSFKIIEINPRCWMQNSFPTRCGINFPYMAYMDAIGKDFEKQIYNGKHIKWLFMPQDVLSILQLIRQGDLSFKNCIKSLQGDKEYAIFSSDDPLPFFVLLSNLIFRPKEYI